MAAGLESPAAIFSLPIHYRIYRKKALIL